MLTLSRWSYLVLIVACMSVAACDNGSVTEPTNPSLNVPFSILEVREGTGATAATGTAATVNYTLWLYSTSAAENKGTRVESGTTPPFVVGGNTVIQGFSIGVRDMKVGGLRRVVVPPNLGYGASGAGNGAIPPNATLVFDIELLNVQ